MSEEAASFGKTFPTVSTGILDWSVQCVVDGHHLEISALLLLARLTESNETRRR